jgi:hypothetical protein
LEVPLYPFTDKASLTWVEVFAAPPLLVLCHKDRDNLRGCKLLTIKNYEYEEE